MSEPMERAHIYHAEATLLSGHLELPLLQEIKPQGYVSLPTTGGYLSQRAKDYRLEGVLSFEAAYTQVGGNLDTKPGHGWTTLATSVVEGLNVLDVLTADRVVAQVSTLHPLAGYVPGTTFLGSRFENLRIAGHPVDLDLNMDLFGEKPANDAPYTQDPGFLHRVSAQHTGLREKATAHPTLLQEFSQLFKPGSYNRSPDSSSESFEEQERVECSLVNRAQGGYPGSSYGHVIDVPHFGRIYLATVNLVESDPHPETRIPKKTLFGLTMIRIKMGCIASGDVSAGSAIINGRSSP